MVWGTHNIRLVLSALLLLSPLPGLASSQKPSMRIIAEEELRVSELKGSKLSTVDARLENREQSQKPTSTSLSIGVGNLQLSGSKTVRSFNTKNYEDLEIQPLYSLFWSWQHNSPSQWFFRASAEFAASSQEFELEPLSQATKESARLNSLALGGWLQVGVTHSHRLQSGLVIGYRKWNFQQSASTNNGVFAEEADTFHYGVESRFWFTSRTSLGLTAFGTVTLRADSLQPAAPFSGLIQIARSL